MDTDPITAEHYKDHEDQSMISHLTIQIMQVSFLSVQKDNPNTFTNSKDKKILKTVWSTKTTSGLLIKRWPGLPESRSWKTLEAKPTWRRIALAQPVRYRLSRACMIMELIAVRLLQLTNKQLVLFFNSFKHFLCVPWSWSPSSTATISHDSHLHIHYPLRPTCPDLYSR